MALLRFVERNWLVLNAVLFVPRTFQRPTDRYRRVLPLAA